MSYTNGYATGFIKTSFGKDVEGDLGSISLSYFPTCSLSFKYLRDEDYHFNFLYFLEVKNDYFHLHRIW